MPIDYLVSLTAAERTQRTNLHLSMVLAVVAGALNAGGFLVVGHYTSHMTGMVSSLADNIVLAKGALILTALVSLVAFVSGAAFTAFSVNRSRQRNSKNLYAKPLLIEAILLLFFGIYCTYFLSNTALQVLWIGGLLCFVMGLQNALITKISLAEIRTTHVTGLITDVGIALGREIFWALGNCDQAARSQSRSRLQIHAWLLAAFFVGGLSGAYSFKALGFLFTIPLSLTLGVLSLVFILHNADESDKVE